MWTDCGRREVCQEPARPRDVVVPRPPLEKVSCTTAENCEIWQLSNSVKHWDIFHHFSFWAWSQTIYELNIIILNEFCRTINYMNWAGLCSRQWISLHFLRQVVAFGGTTYLMSLPLKMYRNTSKLGMFASAGSPMHCRWGCLSKVGNVVEVACHDYKRRKWKTIPWKPQFRRTFWGLCWALPEIWAGSQLPNVN